MLVKERLGQWRRPGLKLRGGPSEAHVSLIPLSPEGRWEGRGMLFKLEHADVLTLLARRYDRIIGRFPVCQDDTIFPRASPEPVVRWDSFQFREGIRPQRKWNNSSCVSALFACLD